MAAVYAGLGLLGLISRLVRVAQWLQWSGRRQMAVAATAVALAMIISLGDALTSNTKYFETRHMAADVGRWLRQEYPSRPMVVGPVGITPIVSYYARNCPSAAFPWEADDGAIMTMVEQSRADVVLLRPTKQLTADRVSALTERLRQLKLEPVPARVLAAMGCDFSILVRSGRPEVAQRPRDKR